MVAPSDTDVTRLEGCTRITRVVVYRRVTVTDVAVAGAP